MQDVQPAVAEVLHGTLRLGLWCPKCLLPSGYEADVLLLTEHGVGPGGALRGCTESDDPTHFPVTWRQVA